MKKGNKENIWSEVSGGKYKHLRYDAGKDVYYYDELEKEFSITIEITYKEEITEKERNIGNRRGQQRIIPGCPYCRIRGLFLWVENTNS